MAFASEADRALWGAVLMDDPDGVRAAIRDGADVESRIQRVGLAVCVRSMHRYRAQDRNLETLIDFTLRHLEREPPTAPKDSTAEDAAIRASLDTLWTPLLAACRWGSAEVRDALLAGGADPDGADEVGLTPLLIAIRRGDTDAAQALLDAGADPNRNQPGNSTLDNGRSPLVHAASDGHVALVELLLAHGATVDARDPGGRTALLAACSREVGWPDIDPEAFAEAAADGTEAGRTESGETAGDDPIEPLRRLADSLAGKSWNNPSSLGALFPPETPERTAAAHDVVDRLLAAGADPNAVGTGGMSRLAFGGENAPLIAAVARGDRVLAERLLAAGATLSPPGETTPLHAALRPALRRPIESAERLAMLRFLLDRGAPISETDDSGDTPLAAAVRVGDTDAVALLIERGADIDERQPDTGATLLHVATMRENSAMVEWLLDAGLTIDAPCRRLSDRDRREAEWARLPEKARTWLSERTPEPSENLIGSAADDTPAADGVTALMLAAGKHNASTIALLLDRGANPAHRDSLGRSARDWAMNASERFDARWAQIDPVRQSQESDELTSTLQPLPDDMRAGFEEQIGRVQEGFASMWQSFHEQKRSRRDASLALLPDDLTT